MAVKGSRIKRTSTYGTWSWNDELLQSKVGPANEIGCKEWLGSQGPFTSLFGAVRNGRPQMTQARRVLMMSLGVPNIEESAVRMRCNNEFCVNTDHMYLEGNRRTKCQRSEDRVELGFTETRIGYHKWQSITEEQRTNIQNLAALCEARVHFDHEFMFYSITWTSYGWFKAKLKDPETTDLLTVSHRKNINV